MRWILCALLLLSISPAVASAQAPESNAPTIGILTPNFLGGADTHPFFSKRTVTALVSRVEGSTGTLTVTVKVNGEDPVPLVNENPLTPGVFTADDLAGFVTQDPLDPNNPNTTLTVTAVDSQHPSEPGTLTVTGFFDDQIPVATIAIISPGVDPDGTTRFSSVQIAGTMSDNDPTFRGLIRYRGFADLFALPDKANFNQRIDLDPGVTTIAARPIDTAGNFPDPNDPNTPNFPISFTIRRITPCDDPEFITDPNTNPPIQVDRFDDLPDPALDDDKCDVRPDLRPPGGVIPPGLRRCTLRAAIQTANHRAGNDVIRLPLGIVVLGRGGVAGDTEEDASGDLDVTSDIRIVGVSRDGSIIDARKLGDRVFDVEDGASLQLLRLSVTGGHARKPRGAAEAEGGGCVRSRGGLHANNAAFLGCKSDGAGGAVAVEHSTNPALKAILSCSIVARSSAKTDGAAIAVDSAPFALRNSTVALNTAGRRGGALAAVNDGAPITVDLSNVTMSLNKAKTAGGSLELGAGVTAEINNCTFTSNAAKDGVTLSTIDGGQVKVSNSILGDGKRACDSTAATNVLSRGGNVERFDACISSPTQTDQQNVDPKLDRLATNSGPPTHALKLGSPALDRAGTGEVPCEPLDARGVARGDWPLSLPDGGTPEGFPAFCDAGAFERFVSPVP